MKQSYLTILITILFSAATTVFVNYLTQPTTNDRIAEYYEAEVAVSVSPHGLRKQIAKGDTSFLLVDLRSAQEYNEEHVVTAVNVPAYSDPDTSAYDDVERIVKQFNDLKIQYPNRSLIVYCYSIPCMTGRKIGHMLADHGIYVKHLGIGWNEWRYHWELWNHPHEWSITDVNDYVSTGSEPGTFTGTTPITPCIEGEFGC